jgi:hypothetical protein
VPAVIESPNAAAVYVPAGGGPGSAGQASSSQLMSAGRSAHAGPVGKMSTATPNQTPAGGVTSAE